MTHHSANIHSFIACWKVTEQSFRCSHHRERMEGKKERQLAAVMFTDIVGYTALMQGDEAKAAGLRKRHREVFNEQHALFEGRIVQYYGDGTLSVFKSAVEASNCALAIQRILQVGDHVPLRIGIHLGDIVYDNTEVYGDGVNLASRIESLSTSGAILLSDKVNDELKNHSTITTQSLGSFNLKNVERSVEVFAVTNEGVTVPERSELRNKAPEQHKTIAVLPFVNMSASEENEYFSDGITEDIITALSKIEQLKVTSRTSSFYFKGKHVPLKEIARELNVSTILEGSVRLAGGMIRVNAQLIEAEQDFHFWSDTWDRKLENIFEIQDEISLAIADKLREQLGHLQIEEHLVEKQTDSVTAYEFFLKGRFHFRKWNPTSVNEALSFYQRAIELDPKHTESYVGLADSYSFLATTGFLPEEEGWAKSAEMTAKAQALEEENDGVQYLLANQQFFLACDHSNALQHALKAAKLNPNNVEAQQFIAFLYLVAGNHAQARQHLDHAISIDPLSVETMFYNAYYQYVTGDSEQALKELNACLERNPANLPAHVIKCYVLLHTGRAKEVINYFDRVPMEIVVNHDKLGLTALAYAYLKDDEKTKEYLARLQAEAKEPNGFRAHSFLLLMHVAMGYHEPAFQWIDQAIKDKFSFILFHFMDPLVAPLRSDPRYAEYHNVLYPEVATQELKPRKKPLLSDDDATSIVERLNDYMRKERPYLKPDLTLRQLAEQIAVHPNKLSWLLNEHLHRNFNEFINRYRVENFKRLAMDKANSVVTLLGLAYDSGFNSKTAFNTYFKKETGQTPKQFLEEQDGKE